MSEVLLDLSPTGDSGRLVRETMSSHDAKCLALQKIYHAKLQSVWYHDYLEAKEESELRMNVVEETRRVVKMTITFIQENYQKKNDDGERTEASRPEIYGESFLYFYFLFFFFLFCPLGFLSFFCCCAVENTAVYSSTKPREL